MLLKEMKTEIFNTVKDEIKNEMNHIEERKNKIIIDNLEKEIEFYKSELNNKNILVSNLINLVNQREPSLNSINETAS